MKNQLTRMEKEQELENHCNDSDIHTCELKHTGRNCNFKEYSDEDIDADYEIISESNN